MAHSNPYSELAVVHQPPPPVAGNHHHPILLVVTTVGFAVSIACSRALNGGKRSIVAPERTRASDAPPRSASPVRGEAHQTCAVRSRSDGSRSCLIRSDTGQLAGNAIFAENPLCFSNINPQSKPSVKVFTAKSFFSWFSP